MKKITLMCVVAVLLVGFIFLNVSGDKKEVSAQQQTTATANQRDKISANAYFFAYQVDIHSAVLTDQGSAMTFSEFSWQMNFQPHASASTKSAAMLSNIQFVADNKVQAMPEQLPFLVKYKNHQFSELDMLGLSSQHPLSVLSKVLDLMSYSLDKPLTFEDALGVKTFQYVQRQNMIERSITEQKKSADNEELEQWLITLDGDKPESILALDYSNKQIWRRDGQQYQVVQSVTVKPIKHTPFEPTDWLASHNQHVLPPTAQVQEVVIVTNENFLEHIQSLRTNLDPMLAKEIGLFMLENFDQSALKRLFQEHEGATSAFIYALQKAQTMQAEQMLSDLLIDSDLSQQVQQKLVMALGRFENASEVGFASLRHVVEQSSTPALSDMALLSIGTMSKFSPDQSRQVANYLTDQLANPQQLSTAVLAMANSKNPQLIAKLPVYLQHSDMQVRKSAIKSLARMADYQDQVVSSLVASPQVGAIDAFSRVYQQANYKLSTHNLDRLEHLYQSQSNPVVKKRLNSIVNM
ncbi:HEAT repeat domain-containing protein [Pseudoalteromonas obscura]|uniref:HEAT repeat domain-containing protein n=1 Tax=Pseudoalteromonas obscura TaxID=3048491 RepID=A0ABT7EKN8_9GAMM|nr:HEAT repeat domain-containing protein [Pseudoalteromonas sp. P94(2023)]MDK2595592.1 HEAT repeat domain-containing protein [Pseudoalteromonas sp. P94(2023)]